MTKLSTLLMLAQDVPDPDDVKPGVLGLVVFLLLVGAVVFLAFSFRKQVRKVNFPENGEGGDDEPDHPDDQRRDDQRGDQGRDAS